ncbi:angiomotin-like 2b [Brachyhypopomus gauderio]|uniref:angiomotin-like 2b n=1 Tax=Brachyhypopomus gauderio TaxID=698409 RepID=UPI0040428D11
MRTEETSGTVLHRLIQEQLRYGNPTDTRTLLAIQQQALRRGGGSGGSSSGGGGSSQSSSASLSQDDSPSPQLSARQEPQGQEHKVDHHHHHSEGHWFSPPSHHEQLPTYEQAKAQSQYLGSRWCQENPPGRACSLEENLSVPPTCDQSGWDGSGHARSLSERLMWLSLQRQTNGSSPIESPPDVNSRSYTQVPGRQTDQHWTQTQPPCRDGYSPQHQNLYPPQCQDTASHHAQAYECFHSTPPPPLHPPHHRLVTPVPSPEAHHVVCTAPPADVEVLTISRDQMELLMNENERLRHELEGHAEKTFRIQKLEQEIQRISEAYDTLIEGCVKREALEQTLHNKLMSEVRRLQDLNADLRDSSIQAAKQERAADQDQQIMAKLCEQRQEEQLRCEQLEKETQVLRGEVEVQRRRAEALDAALSTAQAHTRQLQAQLHRKNAYVERVGRLQGALAHLQATCQKREGLELRLRTRLEHELRTLRNQQRQAHACSAGGPSPSVTVLLECLREREEQILALEADMMRWEQKYLEESTMRELVMDVAATAAAQRDTNMIKHSPSQSSKNSFSEDLPHVELKNQEVETRIRALYGQIQEKDAVISFLQQRLQQDQENCEEVEGVSSLSPAPSAGTRPTQAKEKCSTEDQTATASPCSVVAAVCKARSRTEPVLSTTRSADMTISSREPCAESIQQQSPQSKDPFKGLVSLEPEAVEIFI